MATALDLVCSADMLDAEAAASVGLAHTVHPPEQLMQRARELADR